MSDGKKRIKIVFHPDGRMTAATEGVYGRDCIPYLNLICNALEGIPEIPFEQAGQLLSEDYYSYSEKADGWDTAETARKQYIQAE